MNIIPLAGGVKGAETIGYGARGAGILNTTDIGSLTLAKSLNISNSCSTMKQFLSSSECPGNLEYIYKGWLWKLLIISHK